MWYECNKNKIPRGKWSAVIEEICFPARERFKQKASSTQEWLKNIYVLLWFYIPRSNQEFVAGLENVQCIKKKNSWYRHFQILLKLQEGAFAKRPPYYSWTPLELMIDQYCGCYFTLLHSIGSVHKPELLKVCHCLDLFLIFCQPQSFGFRSNIEFLGSDGIIYRSIQILQLKSSILKQLWLKTRFNLYRKQNHTKSKDWCFNFVLFIIAFRRETPSSPPCPSGRSGQVSFQDPWTHQGGVLNVRLVEGWSLNKACEPRSSHTW